MLWIAAQIQAAQATVGQNGGELWVRIAIFIYPLFTWLVWYWVLGIGLGIGFWAGPTVLPNICYSTVPNTQYSVLAHQIFLLPTTHQLST